MKKKFKISMIILVVLAASGFFAYHKLHHKKPAPVLAPSNVVVAPVKQRDVPIQIEATGNLSANQQSDISPETSGYVAKIEFNEGSFVKQGAVLVSLDTREQAAKVAQARSAAQLSEDNYERNAKLGTLALSKQDLENLHSIAEQNKAALLAAQTVLNQMTLRAPFSGYVGAKTISVGDFIPAGQKIVTLTDLSELKISYEVPGRYADQLQLGQSVAITPDNTKNSLKGRVSYIAPTIDEATQTIEVHAVFDNPQNTLKAGQFVTLTQIVGLRKNAILIPENTLQGNVDGYYVLAVDNNKHVISRSVTPGEHYQGNVIITQGLSAQDQIIVNGQQNVKVGDVVAVANSAVSTKA